MGQKINPTGFRLAVTKDWASKWFAKSGDFPGVLKRDIDVRAYLKKRLHNASVGKVVIERPAKSARITIYTARPGVVIGKKGEDIEVLKKDLQKLMGMNDVYVNIEEIRNPELNAQIIADGIAQQLEKRVQHRRAMRRAMQLAMKYKAKGIKIKLAGRFGGADIARVERYHEGRVPLHTLRADVDYATSEAFTTYGVVGVKVWVYRGDVMNKGAEEESAPREAPRRHRKAGGRNAAAK